MARGEQDDRYDDEYDDEAYDDELLEDVGEENVVLQNIPWFAISLALHAIMLLVAAAWQLDNPLEKIPDTIQTAIDPVRQKDPPIIKPKVKQPDRDDDEIPDPTEDPRIEEDAQDDRNEDPMDLNKVNRPNPDDSLVESDWPDKGANSSLGLGANVGGGRPGGFGNGFERRRARGGGRSPADHNVMAALYWLADHQKSDGSWDASGFHEECGSTIDEPNRIREGTCANISGSEDTGWTFADPGVTGLALLAFLGAGYTHSEGEFKSTVKKGLRWLKDLQDNDGCFSPRDDHHFVYNHAIAAMAMIEAYGMTGARTLKPPAQRGVDFIAACQNEDPDEGYLGWRYGVQPGDSDSSVTGWMILALKSAKMAKLEIPPHCWEGAARHYDALTGILDGYPKTGYITKKGANARLRTQQRYENNPSMDAINVMVRLVMPGGADRGMESTLESQAQVMVQENNLPQVDDPARMDFYYWYYASLALFQMGGNYWKQWEDPMKRALTGTQRLESETRCEHGSWDTDCAWGVAGGRVYTTAINALTLEVYYRYEFIGANRRD